MLPNVADYQRDLAYIHDAGFGDHCRKAAPWLLRAMGPPTGDAVVDLGCGSGVWARILAQHGYPVVAVDQSPAFLRLARKNAPHAEFIEGSVWKVRLPRAQAVTALGEVLNYAGAGRPDLALLCARVHAALPEGGIFIFDIAGPDRIPPDGPSRYWTEGDDWAVLVETEGDRRRALLTRRIVSFRRVGTRYRRSEEVHRLHLYDRAQVLAALRRAGFQAEALPEYGRYRLPRGLTVFHARKGAGITRT